MKGRTTSAPKMVEKTAATKAQNSNGSDDTSAEFGTKSAPNREQIALRAYELFLARGSEPGHEEADWLAAEAELSA